MNDDQNAGYRSNRYRLGLNTGSYPEIDEKHEVIAFDRELEPIEYKCIEQYLSEKYDISINSTECKPIRSDPITDEVD